MEINRLIFELRVLLGKASLEGTGDLMVGDILVLNQLIDDPLPIKVGEEILFSGIPGLSGAHKGIKIVNRHQI